MDSTHREGRLVVDDAGHAVHWTSEGSGPNTLLVLHGGPGMGHTYLRSLAQLAGADRRVVFYDQLGSGISDAPTEPEAWTVARCVDEVEAVRTGLGLGQIDLYGHSWGGWLALSYVLAHPGNVRSLVLSGTSASVGEYLLHVQPLRTSLGVEKHRALQRAEAAGAYTDPEYLAAVRELSARYFCRVWPFDVETSMQQIDELVDSGLLAFGPAYERLWGPNEFACTGPLVDWDVSDRLHEITAPALITCGLYDEVSLECSRSLAAGLPDNEFVILGNSSHMTMIERESHLYLAAIGDFLRRRAGTGGG